MGHRYYYDLEFLEGTQTKNFLGFKYKTPPTINLISIGIVSEDSREYYAISKEFNLKEAWNRYDEVINKHYPMGPEYNRIYWIRENILKPIYNELIKNEIDNYKGFLDPYYELELDFNYKYFKKLINKYGKSNKQIAQEVKEFCTGDPLLIEKAKYYEVQHKPFNLYGYYSAYDHVVFCWLFGKMIDLPTGFPMYTRDLKQLKDEIIERAYNRAHNDFEKKLILDMDSMKDYPKQTNEHNALADARWNKELHKFLKQLN